MLCALVDDGDRLGNLLHATALLFAGCTDFTHQGRHAADSLDYLGHRGARFVDLRASLVNLQGAGGDQLLDLLGCGGRALRQGAHLGSHHRKAPALLARACSFHRSIQRQDVGLEGDGVNHPDDVADAIAAVVDALHGVHHVAHHRATLLCHPGSFLGELVGTAGAFGVLAHGGAHFVHRRGRLLQRCGLLLGAGGQIVVARRDFTARGRHAFCTLANGAHHFGEALAHVAQARHDADFVPLAGQHLHTQITVGHGQRHALEVGRVCPQVAHHRAQVPAQARKTGHHQHHHRHGDVAVGSGQAFHLVDGQGQALALALFFTIQHGENFVARRDGAIHQEGERFILLAVLDEAQVFLSHLPELVHQALQGHERLATFVIEHPLAQTFHGSSNGFALVCNIGQRGFQFLGVARQNGVAQLQRYAGDVQFHLRDALQLGYVDGAHRIRIVADAAHHEPDGHRHSGKQHKHHAVDQQQALAQRPSMAVVVHEISCVNYNLCSKGL